MGLLRFSWRLNIKHLLNILTSDEAHDESSDSTSRYSDDEGLQAEQHHAGLDGGVVRGCETVARGSLIVVVLLLGGVRLAVHLPHLVDH